MTNVEDHIAEVTRRRINKILHTPICRNDYTQVGETVFILRDGSGCLDPALVTNMMPYYYEVIQNGRVRTSSTTRTRPIKRQDTSDIIEAPLTSGAPSEGNFDEGGSSDDDITINVNDEPITGSYTTTFETQEFDASYDGVSGQGSLRPLIRAA